MSVVEKVKSYIGAYYSTDIRALLHADHEQIGALTEEISSDASTQKRVRAFDQLKPFLTAHARAEEQAVYIPLVNLRGLRTPAPMATRDLLNIAWWMC
jgi:hemerythrin superfamily protein